MLAQMAASPVTILKHVSLVVGKYMGSQYSDKFKRRYRNEEYRNLRAFGLGVMYLPAVLLIWIVLWPVVFLHKLKVLVVLIIRNFICCCLSV